jgi:hypothetical protein
MEMWLGFTLVYSRSTMDVEPRQPATLPLDLLLEIIARSDDVTTVVRCAVGCKALLDPGFHCHRAEANGGFDPGLLMVVSYRPTACHIDSDEGTVTGTNSIIVQPPGASVISTLRHGLAPNFFFTFTHHIKYLDICMKY